MLNTSKRSKPITSSETFGDRLNALIDKVGIPERGRKAWLEREFNVSKRTPSLWLEGVIPRHAKLSEIASTLNTLAGLEESPEETEHWLLTGKRPTNHNLSSSSPKNGDIDGLDHFTKSLILKEILARSLEQGIDLHNLNREEVNNIIYTLYTLVKKHGEAFVGSHEFDTILKGQLEQARQLFL